MKNFVLLFFALHTTLAKNFSTTFTSDDVVSKLQKTCQDIACPFNEDPICVKMRYKNGKVANKTFYIVMSSKCEMKYMNCYNGLGIETTELPMKFCEHSNAKKSKLRIKRNADAVPKSVEDRIYSFVKKSRPLNMEKIMGHAIAALKKKRENDAKKDPTKNNKAAIVDQAIAAVKKNRENDKSKKGEVIFNSGSSMLKKPLSSSGNTKSKGEKLKKVGVKVRKIRNTKDKNKVLAGKTKVLLETEKGEMMALRNDDDTDQSPENVKTVTVKERNIDDLAYVGGADEPDLSSRDHSIPKPMEESSGEPEVGGQDDGSDGVIPDIGGPKKTTEKVNIEQYNAQCPTVCPARVLMVCGRCKHGIYRTFMSTCHLRQFTCNMPEEGLTLVSRYPCGLSAPFLANMADPQGVVEEQEDDDPVLRYITCRSDSRGYRWMKMNDPRCNFYKPKKYLLYSEENVAHGAGDLNKSTLASSDIDSSGDHEEPPETEPKPASKLVMGHARPGGSYQPPAPVFRPIG